MSRRPPIVVPMMLALAGLGCRQAAPSREAASPGPGREGQVPRLDGRVLTPEENTGIGIWTEEMFVKAMRTGKHMGTSRPILPPMPWETIRNYTDEDLKAIFAYLRSLPPVKNRVPEAIIAPPPPAASAKP